MKTAIIIDSTSYVNEGLRNHPDVYELFLTTTFEDGTQFLDSTDVKVQKISTTNYKLQISYPPLHNPH